MQELGNRQVSHINLSAGSFSIDTEISVTPIGLVSITALVSAILLCTAVLVQAAKK